MLSMTTSCDAGVRVDVACDSCEAPFSPRASIPQVPAAMWQAALNLGWSETAGMHYCPTCTHTRGQGRLAKVAPGAA
jgi:hypothetical protein